MRPAVFFDRDGVVNELVVDPGSGLRESPLSPEEVRLVPGAATSLGRLQAAGFTLVGVSNQPAAAKQTVSRATLDAIQERVLELLRRGGFVPDGFRICFHHPEGTDAELGRSCACRKPAPGMLLDAARELGIDLADSWMVGDTDGDIEAGRAAGCRTLLVETAGSEHKRGSSRPDARAATIVEAVGVILDAVEE